MLQPQQPAEGLTKRQREVLYRLELGMGAKQIANDIGVSRNAVYQVVERLRRRGALPEAYTPSGQPPRRSGAIEVAGLHVPRAAPRESGLAELRSLAAAGAEGEERGYAEAIEAAISSGDAVALAYELGRLDSEEAGGLPLELVESALRRLGVLPSPGAEQ